MGGKRIILVVHDLVSCSSEDTTVAQQFQSFFFLQFLAKTILSVSELTELRHVMKHIASQRRKVIAESHSAVIRCSSNYSAVCLQKLSSKTPLTVQNQALFTIWDSSDIPECCAGYAHRNQLAATLWQM